MLHPSFQIRRNRTANTVGGQPRRPGSTPHGRPVEHRGDRLRAVGCVAITEVRTFSPARIDRHRSATCDGHVPDAVS